MASTKVTKVVKGANNLGGWVDISYLNKDGAEKSKKFIKSPLAEKFSAGPGYYGLKWFKGADGYYEIADAQWERPLEETASNGAVSTPAVTASQVASQGQKQVDINVLTQQKAIMSQSLAGHVASVINMGIASGAFKDREGNVSWVLVETSFLALYEESLKKSGEFVGFLEKEGKNVVGNDPKNGYVDEDGYFHVPEASGV